MATDVPVDAAPLVLIDEPGWSIDSVSGTDDLPLGDIDPNRLVLMPAESRYGGTMFSAWTSSGTMPVDDDGRPVTVGAVEGRVYASPRDGAEHAVGLLWPLGGDRVAHVYATGMPEQEVLALAATLVDTGDRPMVSIPDGFVRVDTPTTSPWLQFEYQYTDGDRIVQVGGSNLGAATFQLPDGGSSRVVDEGEIAYAPSHDEAGAHQASWLSGSWSYMVKGRGFANEDQFLDAIAGLRVTDRATFAQATSQLDVLMPGARDDVTAELLDGVSTPPGIPVERWPESLVATSRRDFAFRIYFGVACAWRDVWQQAVTAGDGSTIERAVEGAQSVSERATAILGQDYLNELTDAMRKHAVDDAAAFGSNDCPTWSNLGP